MESPTPNLLLSRPVQEHQLAFRKDVDVDDCTFHGQPTLHSSKCRVVRTGRLKPETYVGLTFFEPAVQ